MTDARHQPGGNMLRSLDTQLLESRWDDKVSKGM